MENAPVYIGFNTVGAVSPPYSLTDIELVKQDILNAFHTRQGERVMMPHFGSTIWNLLMDPFDHVTEGQIIGDAERIIAQEPRVQLVSINTISETQSLQLEIQLNFLPSTTADTLLVKFERDSREAI